MDARLANRDDIFALTALWQECFGDPHDYIEAFYAHRFDSIYTPILTDGKGRVIGMTHLLPCVYKSGGKEQSAYYLYAVGLARAYRGLSVMRPFFEAILNEASKNGRALLLSPVNENLVHYYQSYGFEKAAGHFLGLFDRAALGKADNLSFFACESDAYLRARTSCLAGQTHLAFPFDGVDYALKENALCGGYALCSSEGDCALFFEEGGHAVLREFCVSTKDMAKARARLAALLDHLALKSCEVHTHFCFCESMQREDTCMAYGGGNYGYMNLLLD